MESSEGSVEAVIARALVMSYIRSLYMKDDQEIRSFMDENGRMFNELADVDEPMVNTYEDKHIVYLHSFLAPTKEEIDSWVREHHFAPKDNESKEDYRERLNHSIVEDFAGNFLEGIVNEVIQKIAEYVNAQN
ncbi:MAG TPA: hypothetical protein OIL83_05195 [Veillonellaceae bacterium]|uniref:hypothetical protein n=1 Tax=Dialister hominis TaxID=2582419 RepID=UPI003521D8BD|nr:hypothetical protein [Veillonellaceae bacterium]